MACASPRAPAGCQQARGGCLFWLPLHLLFVYLSYLTQLALDVCRAPNALELVRAFAYARGWVVPQRCQTRRGQGVAF
jgi:hypothetical protein